MNDEIGLNLSSESNDKFLNTLHWIIKLALKVLAVLMTFVIVWGVGDVIFVIYNRLQSEPKGLLDVSDMFTVFGAFLAEVIAIEIFINIAIYLKDNVIHVRLVIATALMAVARKVIIFDYDHIDYRFVISTGVVVFALGLTYWLTGKSGHLLTKKQLN